MSGSTLRVLCVEDYEDDAALLKAHLELNEFDVDLLRVETEDEFFKALNSKEWDVVLADYNLPQFSAPLALDIARASGYDIPFIVVSGTIGENRAIEMMRAGANDFIVKGDFNRLVPAIRRELKEAENRKARIEAEQALKQSEASFNALADSMPLLVWTLTKDGSLLFANSRWWSYSGLKKDEISGRNWTIAFDQQEAQKFLEHFNKHASQEKEFGFEHTLKSKDGTSRWFLTQATPTRNSVSGEIEVWYLTSTDIHEQKLTEAELKRAKAEAEQASRAKSQFLANMSHEIRTPLGAMLGFADLMADPDQSYTDRLDCIATIKRNGDQLSRVINEILDLSKVESDRLELEFLKFDLSELISDLTTLLGLSAQEKGLKLTVLSEETVPQFVRTDPTRLRQILFNVVGNAIKFTDRGEVSIEINFIPGPKAEEGDLEFRIKDTGPGLTPTQASRLFQAFVQGDASMTRKHGGTGLGLALSRKLAEALGGSVQLIETKPGNGSTFSCKVHVQVPKQKNNQKQFKLHKNPARINFQSSEKALVGKRILLVEDAADNRLLISRYLTREGAHVDSEENGLTGTQRALSEKYDIILMDIQMPQMDGFEAIRLLRSKNYNGPVIALTAHAMSGYRERCIEAGFNEHLSKPIDRSQLVTSIRSMSS